MASTVKGRATLHPESDYTLDRHFKDMKSCVAIQSAQRRFSGLDLRLCLDCVRPEKSSRFSLLTKLARTTGTPTHAL